jgi:malate dehydrogenase (oxaloacetate-decarboxylating)(NADP+)
MTDNLAEAALAYHRAWPPGKLKVSPTKPLATQRDLALAYSPGVAAACNAIVDDPAEAATVTARANLVAVVTNGTAVLGLGTIGPLAAKPVMEGKAVLFKKFAGIDVFDIEVDATDPDTFVEVVARLEPTFGAINLEDIKAPECFEIEARLRQRMAIPVFHDDQHGTAIVAAAAILNGLKFAGKPIETARLAACGAGAAGLACLDMLVSLGLRKENILLSDIVGVVYAGRTELMDPQKARYAVETEARSLADAIAGADIFLGVSAPGVVSRDMVASMAPRPFILALANPEPEIHPEDVLAVRDDALMATGRSDYPNQVNNVLCFPFLFRGALDVGATAINEAMKHACVKAIAALAEAEVSDVVATAYGGEARSFGADYLIPKPFDPRLIVEIAPAVARAAMDSGVATRPIEDFDAYRQRISQFVFRSGLLMKPIFTRAKEAPRRLIYAEGEERRVLQTTQQVIDEGLARPMLIGRPEVVAQRIEELGLRIRAGDGFDLIDPADHAGLVALGEQYHRLMERRGISPQQARMTLRTNATVLAALLLRDGQADAMLCGTVGRFRWHLRHVLDVIGKAPGVGDISTMNALILDRGTFFLCDTYVTPEPTAEEIAEMTLFAAAQVRRFGLTPKVALLSHSNFGSESTPSAEKMRTALRLLEERAPDLEVEGEMHGDAALSEQIRTAIFPNSRLTGAANLLVMPNLDAANISFNLLKMLGGGIPVGPVLVGAAMPAHVVTPSITVRGLLNMSALAVVGSQSARGAASSA